LNFDCRASRGRAENFSARAGREGKGCGENEFPPRPRFFADAIFRASETGASPNFSYLIE